MVRALPWYREIIFSPLVTHPLATVACDQGFAVASCWYVCVLRIHFAVPFVFFFSSLCRSGPSLAQVPKGLEMVVCNMPLLEHAILKMAPDYGYSKTRRPKTLSGNETLVMNVLPVRYEKEKNLHEMTNGEKLEYVRKRRDLGKMLYSADKIDSAYKQYDKALQVLASMENQPLELTYADQAKELKLITWTNSAA